MKINMAELEERLQSFLEGSLSLIPWGDRKEQIAALLMNALRSAMVQDASGQLIAPPLFMILVHPHDLPAWQSNLPGLDALARILQVACDESGIRFPQTPVIRLASSYDLKEREIQVQASFPAEEIIAQTSTVAANPLPIPQGLPDTVHGYLILNGSEIFLLGPGVTNLGRRADNQIIFQDPRVSRQHAQLRAVRNHYVLFDLNSSGGTYVNGQRISQVALNPGDVISLAGVVLIYAEDTPPESDNVHKTPTSDLKPFPDK